MEFFVQASGALKRGSLTSIEVLQALDQLADALGVLAVGALDQGRQVGDGLADGVVHAERPWQIKAHANCQDLMLEPGALYLK